MRLSHTANGIQKEERPRPAKIEEFFPFADCKLQQSQKTVLIAALQNEGMTATAICREISGQTGQDASTVRKTMKFFREVGFLDFGTPSSRGKKTTLSAAGRALANRFAHNRRAENGEG